MSNLPLGAEEMAVLIGRAGTQAEWIPQPQLPQESAAQNLRANGEPRTEPEA